MATKVAMAKVVPLIELVIVGTVLDSMVDLSVLIFLISFVNLLVFSQIFFFLNCLVGLPF